MPDNGKQKQQSDQTKPIREEQIADIQALAGTLQYGSINLVFQDGVLVQIEKHEKIRVH